MDVINLLSQADRQLGRLDMYSEYIPNIDLFISMHIAKEATQSSKIEVTQTNVEEAFLEREEVPHEKRNDWEEVQNYIQAMNQAISLLDELPFSSRLIRETHKILLQGVRGDQKQPGNFRTSQNWIGGASINDATFIPPVHTSVPELISDIEKFANDELNKVPELLKIALLHYQFETIHPFLDGNGRVGRLMITLYLVSKNILKRPILYLSDFLERNRMLYYDNLMMVREKGSLDQWFKFFLVGVIETAKNSIKTFDGILQLQKQVDAKIRSLGSRAGNAQKIMHHLYQKPLLHGHKVSEVTGLSPTTGYKLLTDLEKLGVLKEVTGAQRGKLYIFKDYLDYFN
ncbi:MAG: Fic family protein [Candidatus Pedobacter colombiensis]|uniref:Fic family protein n=1 Tax=Candidatus Pedobacter colombiensis TaxID=3121371 RepID=A0AAJ5W6W3_9SPHI|nr:Fic family protein [Pedobacter sp.]WEK17652.1 MAG: Fic family protein [Pedobacter sp.]